MGEGGRVPPSPSCTPRSIFCGLGNGTWPARTEAALSPRKVCLRPTSHSITQTFPKGITGRGEPPPPRAKPALEEPSDHVSRRRPTPARGPNGLLHEWVLLGVKHVSGVAANWALPAERDWLGRLCPLGSISDREQRAEPWERREQTSGCSCIQGTCSLRAVLPTLHPPPTTSYSIVFPLSPQGSHPFPGGHLVTPSLVAAFLMDTDLVAGVSLCCGETSHF